MHVIEPARYAYFFMHHPLTIHHIFCWVRIFFRFLFFSSFSIILPPIHSHKQTQQRFWRMLSKENLCLSYSYHNLSSFPNEFHSLALNIYLKGRWILFCRIELRSSVSINFLYFSIIFHSCFLCFS